MTRRAGILILGIAAALLVAEGAARFVYRNATSSGNPDDYIARRGGGPAVTVNSLGFREREVGPKEPGRYRIAIIGDSFTWGQGVEARERFSDLLGGFLGPRYEVLNFGLPGHNMPQHLGDLDTVLRLTPDFVLLELYINNFETADMHRPVAYTLLPGSLHASLAESSLVYQLLNGRWEQLQETAGITESYADYLAVHLRDPNAPDARESFGNLRQFFERARAAGVPSGAVLFPATDSMNAYGANYPFGFLHEHVKSVCVEQRVPCLDLLATFSSIRDPRTTWVSPFDAHPNAEANRRAATDILKAFGAGWR